MRWNTKLVLLPLLSWSILSFAQPRTLTPYFWRLEKEGVVSYGLGTRHSLSSKILPETVTRALLQTKVFVGESDGGFDVSNSLAQAMETNHPLIIQPQGTRLSRLLGPRAFTALRQHARGYDTFTLDHFTVAMASFLTIINGSVNQSHDKQDSLLKLSLDEAQNPDASFLKSVTGKMDVELAAKAQELGSKIEFIESGLDTIKIYSDVTPIELSRLLNTRSTPAAAESPAQRLRTEAEDNRKYMDRIRSSILDELALVPSPLRLTVTRHTHWIEKIVNHHKRGPTFFAFGVSHWVDGERSLVNELRKQGFRVELVHPDPCPLTQ